MASELKGPQISYHEPKEIIRLLTEKAISLISPMSDVPFEVKEQLVTAIQIGDAVQRGELIGTKEHIQLFREAITRGAKPGYLRYFH